MESVAKGMQLLITKLLEVRGECPECGGNLYGWKTKNSDGSERCQPTCMSCGHYDLKRKADMNSNRIYKNSLKQRAIGILENMSVVSDKTLFKKKIHDFKRLDDETTIAENKARSFINQVLLGNPVHMLLSGKSGVGKSHLSMGICWEVLERSNYDKKCIFINYRELLEQIRYSYSDENLRKQIQGSLMADLKTVDLVVIDDLGAELGGNDIRQSKNYNNDVIYSILEARQNQALVINSNLSTKEIKAAYGERILSRIIMNSDGFRVGMKTTKDKRMVGV
jgi:DNA replication protein DnaC